MKLSTVQKNFYRYLPPVLVMLGVLMIGLSFGPLIKDEVWFYLKERKQQEISLAFDDNKEIIKDSAFARFLTSKPILIEPLDKEFGLVIERIGVNVPVVKDVSVRNKDAYYDALKHGVAHASASKYPSRKPGNVYIFAHASLNFWRLGKYSSVFNLLRKLEMGDKIHVFYESETYIYSVVNKERYKGWNTYPLDRAVIEPVLTLQTCDPPGTTLNRLVVTAKLEEVVAAPTE